jgi:hypothetical protein
MIEDLLKKFGGRFENDLTTYNANTLLPIYSFVDKNDGERFQIQIDSLAADTKIVLENVLNDKIIYKRDSKINAIINEKKL